MPTVFITSASRGLGLEFARQYAADGWRVLAACRAPESADILAALPGDIRRIAMDVTDLTSVEAVARESDEPIDLLLNTAGIIGQTDDAPGAVNYADFARVLDTNTMGPVRVLDALAPRLAASERRLAVAITSGMGSISDLGSGNAMMYRVSKAGLNMAMVARAKTFAAQGITVAVINPGWVKTDMGGENAAITPEASVAGMRSAIDALTPADSGRFLNWRGDDYAW